jgi:hypothetical protein
MMNCPHYEIDPKAIGAGCSCGALWTPERGWYLPEIDIAEVCEVCGQDHDTGDCSW